MTQMKKRVKTQKTLHMRSFLKNHNNPETEIYAFCVITFEPIKVQTLSSQFLPDCLGFRLDLAEKKFNFSPHLV